VLSHLGEELNELHYHVRGQQLVVGRHVDEDELDKGVVDDEHNGGVEDRGLVNGKGF